MVLLDRAAHDAEFQKLHFVGASWPSDFAVAHFDHGIRGDSALDANFVRHLANKYDVKFFEGKASLGQTASEETARARRYEFLRQIAEKFNNARIVTAHHQDDLLETIAMNLLRGTGWRGLTPLSAEVPRPFLDTAKTEIVGYALDRNLEWVEDSTNDSPRYFRNRIRDKLAVLPPETRRRLLGLSGKQRELKPRIENETERILHDLAKTDSNLRLSRYFLIMIDQSSALEILRRATCGKLMRPQLEQVLLFAKTARPNKILQFKELKITTKMRMIVIENKVQK